MTEEQAYGLAIYNIGPGGTVFDDHMKKLAKESGTSVEEATDIYYHEMKLLTQDEYKKNNSSTIQTESGQDTQNTDDNNTDKTGN